ncbi:MAG: hypothetical protein GAK40_00708 [Burkholderia plantarii]|nr:MAG: hypothetical protein GAK40_00708 [Burkholderia plantarii]
MLEGGRLARAKGLLLALFDAAARERAEVVLVCFGGGGAERRFGPAVPRWWNARWLAPLGGAGGTPLARGLEVARAQLAQATRRRPGATRWLWLLSDMRTDERPPRPAQADAVQIVDFDDARVRLGRAERLAHDWDAPCSTPDRLIRN